MPQPQLTSMATWTGSFKTLRRDQITRKKKLSWGHRFVCSVCECRVKINSYHTTAPLRGGLERQWYRKSSQRVELQKMYLVMLFVWNKKWLKIRIYAGLRPRQMAYLVCQAKERNWKITNEKSLGTSMKMNLQK